VFSLTTLARRSLVTDVVTPNIKRQIARMGGEIMREVGVLLLVFAPLDWLFSGGTLTARGIAAIVVAALAFIVVGVFVGLER
jgi:hypothetical protein